MSIHEFHNHIAAFFERLGSSKAMVLATAKDGKVTARTVSCIIVDGMLYFQTDKNLEKYKQITANPTVALCAGNIQIEGAASALGHPLEPQNRFFAEWFEQCYKGSFDLYSSLPDEVLLRVAPLKITLWEYEDNEPYRIFFDVENRVYAKEYYLR
jgi:general stress protein 26